MDKVGVIAFAFGQQGEEKYPEAGPSNEAIRNAAWGIYAAEIQASNQPMIAAQWETSLGLPSTYISLLVSRFENRNTDYVSTKYVLDESIAFFQSHGVKRVIFVAHPLHLFFINLLVRSGIWKVGGIKIDHQDDKRLKTIPYDRSAGNVQKWTRNPVAFAAYMVKALVTGRHGA